MWGCDLRHVEVGREPRVNCREKAVSHAENFRIGRRERGSINEEARSMIAARRRGREDGKNGQKRQKIEQGLTSDVQHPQSLLSTRHDTPASLERIKPPRNGSSVERLRWPKKSQRLGVGGDGFGIVFRADFRFLGPSLARQYEYAPKTRRRWGSRRVGATRLKNEDVVVGQNVTAPPRREYLDGRQSNFVYYFLFDRDDDAGASHFIDVHTLLSGFRLVS